MDGWVAQLVATTNARRARQAAGVAALVLTLGAMSCSIVSSLLPTKDTLTGRWKEIAWLDCTTNLESTPDDPIRELRFHRDGSYSVTWHPIETYVDFRGTYETTDDTIVMSIDWSAYEPSDFDGQGVYRIDDDGTLLLQAMWLGSPANTQGVDGCGHRFERYGE